MNTSEILVCTCCMLQHANGECCPDDNHGGDGIAPWSASWVNDPKVDMIGMGLTREEHSCGREDDSYFGECDCEDYGFSWSSCDGCKSHLGGYRYYFTIFWKDAE